MIVHCAYDELVAIDDLKPNPDNNNKHPVEQLERLAKIIDFNGITSPITVSKRSGYITRGHARLDAFKSLGYEKVPVQYIDYRDEAHEYSDLTADNEIARWAELDEQAVYDKLEEMPNFDIELLGIEDFSIPTIEELDPQCDEDEVPEVPKDPITKRGDVWLLGKHRVMCGDSTMIDDVEKLMNGERADMVFTDPPYGMKLDADYSKMGNTGIKHNNIKGDHEDFTEDLIDTIFYFDYVKEMFIFGADYFAQLLPNRNKGSWIVWDKRSKSEAEIGVLDGAFGSDFELCWSKIKHKREIARILRQTGAFSARGDDRSVGHPTQKPIALPEWFFNKWCEGLNLCVDLYLGSGSTLIACEKTNRKCYGMELDPHYCDVIIERYMKYTGRDDVILEATGEKYTDIKNGQNG